MKLQTAAYLVLLHVIAAIAIFRPTWLRLTTPALQHQAAVLHAHSGIDPWVPDGAAIFLGDSLTAGLATAAVTPNSVNFGITGQTTEMLLNAIDRYRSLHRAGTIYLAIGINDLWKGDRNGVASRLRAISIALPPGPRLIWSGILPTARPEIPLELIESVNATIRAACADRQGCVYVDSSRVLADLGGDAFTDGLHLSPVGYAAWIEALRTASGARDIGSERL